MLSIVSSSEVQRATSEQVANNVQSIAEMAQENASANQQAVASARNLEELADGLQEWVGRFKV